MNCMVRYVLDMENLKKPQALKVQILDADPGVLWTGKKDTEAGVRANIAVMANSNIPARGAQNATSPLGKNSQSKGSFMGANSNKKGKGKGGNNSFKGVNIAP